MKINVTVDGLKTTLAPLGSIDVSNSESLEKALNGVIANPATKEAIIDFAGVDYIGSSGIGKLLMFHKQFSATRKAQVTLINVNKEIATPDKETIILTGRMYDDKEYIKETAPNVLKFESRLKLHAVGGMVSIEDNKLVVDNANSAVLILVAATSYKNYKDVTAKPDEICKSVLNKAANKSYEQLYNRHLEDYTALFDRMSAVSGKFIMFSAYHLLAARTRRCTRIGNVNYSVDDQW